MNIIISKTTSRDTIGEILSYMKNDLTPVWYRLSRHRFITSPPNIADVSIRWGCSPYIETIVGTAYNKNVGKVMDKGKTRKLLYENGIPVPTPVDLERVNQEDLPFVVRPATHQKGKDFLLFNNLSDILNEGYKISRLNNPYASRLYPKTCEYRVHVAHGKVLLVQEKVSVSDEHNGVNWNYENGYSFVVINWKKYRKEIVDLAVRAIEILGLDFGAVDIMADPTDTDLPIAVVCEINTSPRLEGYTAQRYAEYFDWLIETKETRHFEIPPDLEARHYVFKHRELADWDYDLTFKGEW